MSGRALRVAGLSAVVMIAPASALGWDMRECQLDRVTFIDPWAGASFTVNSVVERLRYNCDSGLSEKPIDGEMCRGPYGATLLIGAFDAAGDTEPKLAIAQYHVMDAAPCCGWTLSSAGDSIFAETLNEGKTLSPRLGDYPFASIELDGFSADTGMHTNPMMALVCRDN